MHPTRRRAPALGRFDTKFHVSDHTSVRPTLFGQAQRIVQWNDPALPIFRRKVAIDQKGGSQMESQIETEACQHRDYPSRPT